MKYAPLQHHLAKLSGATWTASFGDIEKILGFRLPTSARKYPAWWANQEHGAQTAAWREVGWQTSDLQLPKEQVTFVRDATRDRRGGERRRAIESQPVARHKWDEAEELSASLKMIWEPLGCISLDDKGRLVFPPTPKVPGLYRFRIRRKGGKEARYVGESDNLHTRFYQNYRHGNASQHTSHRINKELREALVMGTEVSVSIITKKAWIKDGGQQEADLSVKAVRRLFEHFAQCVEGDCIIESLNR